MARQISVIVPTLNEASNIESTLRALQPLRADGHEILVVDADSRDATRVLAGPLCDRILIAERGRALQQNLGASQASGDLLWFVHGDTCVSPGAVELMRTLGTRHEECWGRFDVDLQPGNRALAVIAFALNWRSRLSGICTGDQCVFVTRRLFEQVGCFPSQPLMEDVELSRRLKRLQRPCTSRRQVITSSRRWARRGLIRTVLLMWWLRAAYFAGVSAHRIARWYA